MAERHFDSDENRLQRRDMAVSGFLSGDSDKGIEPFEGGAIPGLPGARAFHGRLGEQASIPVVIAAPHGGRCYPADLVDDFRFSECVTRRLEDRLVDRLADAVALRTGAPVLIAEAPRAMIDLNRSVDDVDWDMVAGAPAPSLPRGSQTGFRARSGLGLVPRRLPGAGELWKGRLPYDELVARIAQIHRPYHATLEAMVEGVRAQWGAVLLIDLHSMPPLPPVDGVAARFVIGDRFGTACDGALVASIFAYLGAAQQLASHNRPYAGGYVLDRHARRAEGIHAVQIEIDRTAYLDPAFDREGAGFDGMVALLTGLVQRLADDVAAIGRERLLWRTAAE